MQAIIDNAYWIIIGLTIVVIALSYALYWKEKKIARIKNKAKAEITQAQNNCELEKQELLTKRLYSQAFKQSVQVRNGNHRHS